MRTEEDIRKMALGGQRINEMKREINLVIGVLINLWADLYSARKTYGNLPAQFHSFELRTDAGYLRLALDNRFHQLTASFHPTDGKGKTIYAIYSSNDRRSEVDSLNRLEIVDVHEFLPSLLTEFEKRFPQEVGHELDVFFLAARR